MRRKSRGVMILLAKPRDVEAIASVYLQSRADALPFLRQVHAPDAVRAWIRDILLPTGETWVAQMDGRIVGFLSLQGQEISQCYLRPGYFRRGIGSLLLAKARQQSPERLWLYTFQRNLRARAFYEAHGFTIVALNDGTRNEEREPDMRYEWHGDRVRPPARLP